MGRDNPVRFIDAFVDGLDLAAAGFERAAPKATGRPGYDPADLLKLYIYGYLNRVRSSRRLEAESKRNLEVIWLLRRLSPDFKTIADFRRINRAAFRQVFREFVRLCRELELFGRELVVVDGTRIKAVNSRKWNFTKAKLEKALAESDERLSRYLDRLDEADGQDEGGGGLQALVVVGDHQPGSFASRAASHWLPAAIEPPAPPTSMSACTANAVSQTGETQGWQ